MVTLVPLLASVTALPSLPIWTVPSSVSVPSLTVQPPMFADAPLSVRSPPLRESCSKLRTLVRSSVVGV